MRPCANYCLGVTRACLSHLADLDGEWNGYVEALLQLAARLKTSFNVESVVDSIDIKISEAIMNFQENGIPVSQRVSPQPRLFPLNIHCLVETAVQ